MTDGYESFGQEATVEVAASVGAFAGQSCWWLEQRGNKLGEGRVGLVTVSAKTESE